MKRPTIFIPIESKKREFDGKVLLAVRMLSYGFRVVMGTKSGVQREAMHASNGLYLAKSASNESLELYRQLKARGHRLAVLDVEGGALTREIKNDLLRSYQPEASEFFDYFYVFGDKIRDAILEDLPYIHPDQVIVTGEPRFDLLRPEFAPFFADEIDAIKKRYSRFVLINTSFGLSNSILGEKGIRTFLETTSDIPDEQRPLYLLKHLEGKHLLQDFVEMAKMVAKQFPALNVVIRPHPDEDPTTYQRMTEGVMNLHVNGTGNVHPWIRSALAVIHHDCTTGMESVMAGKPTISFVPRMEESITAWLPVYLSVQCKTPGAVIEALAQYTGEPHPTYFPGAEKAEVFSSYFRNFTEAGSTLLSKALHAAYQHLHTTHRSSPPLWIARLRSRLNILKYNRNKHANGRERFMSISAGELRRKTELLYLSDQPICLRIPGGNAAVMETKPTHD
jgi:surface carbohydrate biosynthesis protein